MCGGKKPKGKVERLAETLRRFEHEVRREAKIGQRIPRSALPVNGCEFERPEGPLFKLAPDQVQETPP